MKTGKNDIYTQNDPEDDFVLKKNRINSIELPDDGSTQKNTSKRISKSPKIPIIILSSVALILIIGILLFIQFFSKKPSIFTSTQKDSNKLVFDTVKKDIGFQSDNIHIKRGIESYSKEYYNDAIAEFNEVVESDASDKDKAIALTYLGIISDDRGNYKQAIEFYNRALKYDSNNPYILKNRALAYLHNNDFENAISDAQNALSLNPGDFNTRLLLGNILFNIGRYEDAVKQYQEALKISPDNASALYNLGSAVMKTGDEFSAVEYFKKAGASDRIGDIAHKSYSRLGVISIERKDYEAAEKYLKTAVSIRPNDALNRYNLGIAYQRQNKNQEALEEFEKAEKLGEQDSALLEGIGEAYFSMRNYDKSLAVYQKIAKTNSRNIKILSRIGEIYYEKGELDKAFDAYKRVTIIEPATENARIAYLNMGNILDDAQRFDEAIEAYEKALSISPKDDAAYYNLALAYKHAGKPELAIESWKKAAELNTSDPRPSVAIADYYYERNFYDLAEKEYQKILHRWPHIQEAHFNMGVIYQKRNDHQYALRAYNRVLEINENNDLARKAYINSAIIISKIKTDEESLDKSLSLIQKALFLKPGDPDALFSLGNIYSKKGMNDQAIETFFQVIKSSNNNVLIAETYNNIGKCYYKMKLYKKALQNFTRGVEEDPANEEIRMNRKTASQAYETELAKER